LDWPTDTEAEADADAAAAASMVPETLAPALSCSCPGDRLRRPARRANIGIGFHGGRTEEGEVEEKLRLLPVVRSL
jgi:hypothetical protein